LLTADENIKRRVMKESLDLLAQNTDLKKEPSAYITEVHRILKRICGIEVPFEHRRRRCNELGLELGRNLESQIEHLGGFDRFSLLARWSIAGNALDFRTVGAGYDFDMEALQRSLYDLVNRLEVDQLPQIYEKITPAKKILFIHDNVGEIALDKLLIKDIQRFSKASIISAVRGGPITSDATIADAEQVNLREASASVILAGPDTLGISFEEMSGELRAELSRTDLVIAKGQANYYVLSEHKDGVNCPIVCLFRTKCQLVSGMFNHAADSINVAAIL